MPYAAKIRDSKCFSHWNIAYTLDQPTLSSSRKSLLRIRLKQIYAHLLILLGHTLLIIDAMINNLVDNIDT